jgi:hypothetical protein
VIRLLIGMGTGLSRETDSRFGVVAVVIVGLSDRSRDDEVWRAVVGLE